jgi:UDP-glucuronate 4-epimerase
MDYIDANIVGFLNILEGCRHNEVKHLAYASSSSVYGLNTNLPFSTDHPVDHPASLYAATKRSNELMAHTYSHLFGVPTTGLRFFTVYGPWGRPDMALFLFIKAALAGESIKVFNNGDMVRDFTYIDDIVEGIIRVIDTPPKENPDDDMSSPGRGKAAFRVFNIGASTPVPLMDYIGALEKHLGMQIPKEFLPCSPGMCRPLMRDVNRLKDAVDYQPSTSVETGVARFVDWYRQYYKV